MPIITDYQETTLLNNITNTVLITYLQNIYINSITTQHFTDILPHLNITADQCGEPLLCITSKDFIQLQVPALAMIKMFLDDNLHHKYM